MYKTKIDWAESSWNPVTGCFHGCEYCYAKKIAERFGPKNLSSGSIHELNEQVKTVCKDGKSRVNPYPFGFEPTQHRYMLDKPQKWKKPRTIFVCSMADLFGAWVPDEWIKEVFDACEQAPQHRYLFLTKNYNRYIELANKDMLPEKENMWYGVTATTPDTTFFWSDRHNVFISVEPILTDFETDQWKWSEENPKWIIVGAETGTRKDKVVPKAEWITDIAGACKKYGISLFMKNSLIPIVGEENMVREFPWENK